MVLTTKKSGIYNGKVCTTHVVSLRLGNKDGVLPQYNITLIAEIGVKINYIGFGIVIMYHGFSSYI